MRVNTDPMPAHTSPLPPRKPCIRDLHQLTTTLLPANLVALVPLDELERRAEEINTTHPQYQEETPLVVAWEKQRRQRLSGSLAVTVSRTQAA